MTRELEVRNQILAEARERIQRGWCQGAYARGAKGQRLTFIRSELPTLKQKVVSCCAEGAIFLSGEKKEAQWQAIHALEAVLFKMKFPVDVPFYNDSPERTKDEILTLFDAAMKEPM